MRNGIPEASPQVPTLDERRFEFDKKVREEDASRESRALRYQKLSTYWTPLSILIPLLAGVIGFYVRSSKDSNVAKVRFIDRQLSDFYYPIQARLRKDDAMFAFYTHSAPDDADLRQIVSTQALANENEVVGILDKHSDLLFNPEDSSDQTTLLNSIMSYESHVAIANALATNHDPRTPWDVKKEWGYPELFEPEIEDRIQWLLSKRGELDRAYF